jgi:L-malate glycosyltransferase
MKVLHLFSNAKWTGPAEPALNLCVALRRLGVDCDFTCPPEAPASPYTLLETARDRGIEPILRFRLSKHSNPVHNWIDSRALATYLRAHPYDLIHCHLDNDHRIALAATRKLGVPIVRSNYHGLGFDNPRRHGRLLTGTAHVFEPSNIAREHDAVTYGIDRGQLSVVPGAVDTERFDPAREVPDGRRWLGVPSDAFVVGIVARMQTHRHFEDFWQAIRKLVDREPRAHVIVVGRGTNQEKVGKEPVRDLGLERNVHFSGYVGGENYVGMLKAFDVKVFLVPGSDGTCRAVREAMAMGKPAVVADRGMLREIVNDGDNGFVFDGSRQGLFDALQQLGANRQRARAMGRAARETALSAFSLEAQAKAVLAVYESLPGRRTGQSE